MSKPRISAVLPTYNNVAYLPRSIDSLIQQTEENIEIIVVDDCSGDSTMDVLKHYKKVYKRFRYYQMERRLGAAVCRNFGNNKAKADIIMVCDSGDVNHSARAEITLDFFKQNEDVDIFGSACVEVDILDNQIQDHYPAPFKDDEKPIIFHPTIAYRKKLTKNQKYREGNVHTDQYEAFFIEAYRRGFGFGFLPNVLVKKLIQKKDPMAHEERMKQRVLNYIELGIQVPRDLKKYIPKESNANI